MCGIAGTYGINKTSITLKYLKAIKHRGPDEGPTTIASGPLRLGAVRLSIVDVKDGHQPMVEDVTGNVVASNGEIYNYKSLKTGLIRLGYVFKTDCDTEVLLHGFSHYGPKFVEKLNGIFAVAFYRNSDKTLFLFRDFFGVKPLHYIDTRKTLRFSSEIKAFFTERNNYKLDLDFIIFNKIFGCSLPEGSLYKSIKTLKPGSYLEYRSNFSKIKSYKSSVFFSKAKSWDEAKKSVYKEFNVSVKSQIPLEVNWAVLLSGGVDSSILSWVAQKNYSKRIKTFSVCSKEMETEDFINARKVAKFIDSDHNEIRVDSENAIRDFPDYLLTIEDINPRFLFYYYLAKALEGKVKVGFCGEGADELFAGYPVYRDIEEYISAISEKYNKFKNLLSSGMKTEISSIIRKVKSKKFDYLYEFMIFYQMPYFQLNPVDKCSMRFGIELRVPYLSLNSSLAAMKYQKSWLLKGDVEKKLLRDSFKTSRLPTIDRKKVFAGTRTLPSFYQKLQDTAELRFPELKTKYKAIAKVLDPKELFCLDLLDTGMRKIINKQYGRTN